MKKNILICGLSLIRSNAARLGSGKMKNNARKYILAALLFRLFSPQALLRR